MIFGFTEDYAIRFLIYLGKYPDRNISCYEISKMMTIPRAFLLKIAKILENAGIIEIKRGKKGGYRLKKEPSQVSLLDIIESIKGKIILHSCIENSQICTRSNFCPVHKFWKELNETFRDLLRKKTLEEFIKKEKAIIKSLENTKNLEQGG